jgi:hypothetical protein
VGRLVHDLLFKGGVTVSDSSAPESDPLRELIDETVGAEGVAMMAEAEADYSKFLNSPRVPNDAGESAEGLAAIIARIPPGWGRWIGCGRGWYPLLIEIDTRLSSLDPDYEVHQVKEKYGGLRYYYQFVTEGVDWKQGEDIEDEAERRSYAICEVCGEPGHCRDGGWLQTLCDEHADGRPDVES